MLPLFGGSPAIWITSMLFFQGMLLCGYTYAHFGRHLIGSHVHSVIHIMLVILALTTLPIELSRDLQNRIYDYPVIAVLYVLLITIGLPFFVLSAGAPLLQKWFSFTHDPDAKDPYFLYRASNFGSLLALIAYPVLIEPNASLKLQSQLWAWGYWSLVILVFLAFIATRKNFSDFHENNSKVTNSSVSLKDRIYWVSLAFVPSLFLLSVTAFLTTNITPFPMLWILPLALYLGTYIMAFSKRPYFGSDFYSRWLPILVIPLSMVVILESSYPMLPISLLYMVVFAVVSLMCHTRLSETRPVTHHLTEFYLCIAIGGALGGVFAALVAPIIFNTLAEYPLVVVLACLIRPNNMKKHDIDWKDIAVPIVIFIYVVVSDGIMDAIQVAAGTVKTIAVIGVPLLVCFLVSENRIRFAFSVAALFISCSLVQISTDGNVLLSERSFFGIHRVIRSNDKKFHVLTHGVTIHGKQSLVQTKRSIPLTYYHPTGPIGQVFQVLDKVNPPKKVGIVGLGVGSLASYAQSNAKFTFYEIDPIVISIANNKQFFTFLSDSQGDIETVLGDARLTLQQATDHHYDLLVLDAFSSDAIPVHLLTYEAVQIYFSKIKYDGVVAFHITNRYLDLVPVLAKIAHHIGVPFICQDDSYFSDEEREEGKLESTWFVMSNNKEIVDILLKNGRWEKPVFPSKGRIWSDDYSNILSAIKWRVETD